MLQRAAIAFTLLLAATTATAQFTLQEEDDSLAAYDRSDRGYTQGLRLTWAHTPDASSAVDKPLALFCEQGLGECTHIVAWGVGQNMYTPQDLHKIARVLRDRPYGGWLYGVWMGDALRKKDSDHLEVYAGVTGEYSLARPVQQFWHQYVTPQAVYPRGWGNQIGNHAALLVAYTRRRKVLATRHFDVTPQIGGAAGNVYDYATAGVTVRAGWNLPNTFLDPIPSAIPLALDGARVAKPPEPPPQWDAYVFASADAIHVARNLFLDEQDRQYRIERRPNVRDQRVGISYRYHSIRIDYINTKRSAEFIPDSRPHTYGTVRLVFGTTASPMRDEPLR